MIHDIQHTAISTPDIERAIAFYSGLIGFEIESDFDVHDNANANSILDLKDVQTRVALLRLGESRLELFEFRNPKPDASDPDRPVCNHGITHVCLRVSDIQTEYERLLAGGMHFHCPPKRAGNLTATYGRDPDGNVIELLELD